MYDLEIFRIILPFWLGVHKKHLRNADWFSFLADFHRKNLKNVT